MLNVDYNFSASLRRELERGMVLAANFCRALMGSDAIAGTKTMFRRRHVTFDYILDLDTHMVSVCMAKRNAWRTFFGYMTTYLNLPVTAR
jgi:hypothetical protein